MHRVFLVAIVLVFAAQGLPALAAPALQTAVDPRRLALTEGDLPAGFKVVPDQTRFEERADGVVVFETIFAREQTPENLARAPIQIRSGVARTTGDGEAILQIAA